MKIVVKINKFEDMKILDNADAYLVSNAKVSYRYDDSFSLSLIKKTLNEAKKNKKELYVLVNKIFFDNELDALDKFIKALIDMNIDGIYFADFAVFMICEKYNYQNKCYFYHETFLRNSKDIKTYQELGIKNIICSKDMNLDDIKDLDPHYKDNYGIMCFGYIPLYESKRKIISNYKKQYGVDVNQDSKKMYIKEETRDNKYKIIEQNGTTSVFHDKVLSYIPYLDILDNYLNIFIIDSLFFDVNYIKNIVNIVKNKDINAILDNKYEYDSLFLDKKVGLI